MEPQRDSTSRARRRTRETRLFREGRRWHGVTRPSASDKTIKLLEDDREDAVECRGREVAILGSRNTLHLRGSCPLVILSGSDNVIDVETAQRIRATGDRNRITWAGVTTGDAPQVQNTGKDNRISKADRKPTSP